MGMEIKINAGDMLKVLVNAGIDATDAKAIIFDLLQYPDGNIPERKKFKDTRKQKLKKRKIVEHVSEDDDDDDDDAEEEDEDDEDEDDEEVDDDIKSELTTATRIRRPKRVDFKSFGGPAQTPQFGGKR